MPYQYDVFISYKRGRINEQWLNEIFFPFFENYLDNELSETPRIFIDKTGLSPGVNFSNELFRSLMNSKCMLSIWSPPYFRKSEWCVKEFFTMQYKQEFYKLNAGTMPLTLIWPILYRDIEPMPDIIKHINYLDYSNFNVVGEAFSRSEKYLQLQEKLQDDIASLVEIINNAPPMDPLFETPEGQEQTIKALTTYFENKGGEVVEHFQKPISW